jgi:hypothetical protein
VLAPYFEAADMTRQIAKQGRPPAGPGQGTCPVGRSALTAASEDRSARSHSATLRGSASR